MGTVDEADYIDMSLDDVIRDMKARKAAQEQKGALDNSPFLRSTNNHFNKRRFQAPFQTKNLNNRSNYINHMAKKRIQNAHRTLDLRRRLIALRASKDGLDLRYKVVANMIAKLRQDHTPYDGNSKPNFQPFQQVTHLHSRSGSCADATWSQSRAIRTLSQIEKLVGRLPVWMKTNLVPNVQVQGPTFSHFQSKNSTSKGYPIRTAPRPYNSQNIDVGVQVCQHACSAHTATPIHTTHVAPVCVHTTPVCVHADPTRTRPVTVHSHAQHSSIVPNGYYIDHSHSKQMPPLAYEPPRPTRLPGAPTTSRLGLITQSEDDQIEIVVTDFDGDVQRPKKTLNERFGS